MVADFWDMTEPTEANPDWVYAWFSQRNIGARVVDRFRAEAARWTFDPTAGDVDAIALPLTSKGVEVNRVMLSRKGLFTALEKPKAAAVFNGGAFSSGEMVIWCATEMDVLALAECGITEGVSTTRLDAIGPHSDEIAKVTKIILAMGDDPLGMFRREELARRLGRHRCWIAKGTMFDTLSVTGPDAVTAAVTDATPYPIEGMHQIKRGTLALLRALPAPGVMTTGTSASDAILKLPMEGRLIIVTGYPSHGKTNFTRFLMIHTASQHNRRWCVFSPESQPWEQFAADCAEVYVGKPFYPMDRMPSMTDSDIAEAEAFLADKVTMLVCDAENSVPTLDWLLERAGASVVRDGTTDVLFDPWNEIYQDRKGLSETDFIGLCLQRINAFVRRYGCNAWIVAHPKMPGPLKPGEKRSAPGPYDMAGSANWANRADLGLTVHSPDAGVTELHIWKSRTRRWGTRGAVATMDFDKMTGRYSTPYSAKVPETQDDLLRGNWR